jgi:hypothetical protein
VAATIEPANAWQRLPTPYLYPLPPTPSDEPAMSGAHPIHLAPLYPTDDFNAGAPPSKSFSDSSMSQPARNARARRTLNLSWSSMEDVVWSSLPVILYVITIGLLIGSMLQQSMPYLTATQTSGTARIDYGILGTSPLQYVLYLSLNQASPSGSCATPSNSTEYICTPRSINANFVPSLGLISTSIPGYAALKLPFHSTQTPLVFLCASISLVLSFLLYIPAWIGAYAPHLLVGNSSNLVKDFGRRLYQLAGGLAFVSMILTVTIGLGYKLLLLSAVDTFTVGLRTAFLLHQDGGAGITGGWEAHVGQGFDMVWVTVVGQALVVIGIKAALHNGIDERIERGGGKLVNSGSWA